MNHLFKLISITLIATHITVFCTHDIARADDALEGGAAYSKDSGFVSFDAAQASQADLFTGRATTSIPIFIPPRRKGLQPNVALSYSSGGGNSWLGVGWNLDFGSISRSTKWGVPKYDSTDKYVLNFGGGASELVEIDTNEYRMKHEALFLKIEKDGDIWTVTDKSGTVYTFGSAAASRLTNSNGIFSWHLDRVEDTNGNYMTYTYVKDQGQIYPSQIDYNGHTSGVSPTHQVLFTLEDRFVGDDYKDVTFSYISSSRVTTAKRLKEIEVRVGGSLARKYEIEYIYSDSTGRSLIDSIQEIGKDGTSTLPEITFTYTELANEFDLNSPDITGLVNYGSDENYIKWDDKTGNHQFAIVNLMDINGDGLLDRLIKKHNSNNYLTVQLMDTDASEFQSPISWDNLHLFTDDRFNHLDNYHFIDNRVYYRWFDINGNGLLDRVLNTDDNTTWEIQLNNGEELENKVEWTVNDLGLGPSFRSIQDQTVNTYTESDFFDINGDGYPDRVMQDSGSATNWHVQLNDGTEFASPILWDIEEILQGQSRYAYMGSSKSYEGTSVDNTVADLNGDGLTDRIMQPDIDPYYWKVQFNNGSGFESPEDWGVVIKWHTAGLEYIRNIDERRTRCDLVDMNGDGLLDRVVQINGSNNYFNVQINTGSGFTKNVQWGGVDNLGNSDFGYPGYTDSSRRTKVGLYDINGDGLVDRVMQNSSSATSFKVRLNSGEFPDLIKVIDNGRGGTTTFAYEPSTRYDNTGDDEVADLPFPVQTVKTITLKDAFSNEYTTSYEYEGGKFDFDEREFRGFNKVTVTDPENNKTVNYFYQDDTKQGKLYEKEVYDSEDNLYIKSVTTWNETAPHTGVSFVYVEHEDEYTYEGDSTYRRRRTSFDYDQYGNLTETQELGEYYEGTGNVLGDERTTIHEYAYNTTSWILNTLARTKLKDENTQTQAEKTFYYDNLGFKAQPVKGNLTKEEEWFSTGTNPTTEMTYDQYGNITQILDSRGFPTTNTYDTTYHQFLEQVTNTLDHEQNFSYDACLAKITSTTDPNGNTTTTIYDAFGRPLKIIEPGDSESYPTKQFEYRPFSSSSELERVKIDVREEAGTSNVLTSYTFFDGLGRKIQTRIESEDSEEQVVIDNVSFNSRGLVAQQYVPYFESNSTEFVATETSNPKTLFEYDALGRRTKVTLPDDSFTQTDYDDWKVTVRTNNGELTNEQKKEQSLDAYGRIIKVTEYNNSYEYETIYEYDVRDNLVGLEDNAENVTTIDYDSLGRKIELDDPDTGVTTYAYDANGNLTSQTDANNNTITFAYDGLNRVTSKNYSDSTPDVTYEYDDPSFSNSVGRLTKVYNSTATVMFDYDARGRVSEESEIIDSVTYTYSYVYDSMGRKCEITYPDDEAVVYTFNSGGAIEKVGLKVGQTTDDDYFVSDVDYNAAGQMTKVVYGNEVTTDYTYDSDTLRLNQLVTRNPQLAEIQNLGYAFDNNGNVLEITDSVNTATQDFTYDDLNRLVCASGSYGVIDYEYDSIGNMTLKDPLTLTYGEGTAGPHQVTSSSDGRSFQYDSNGNMTLRGDDNFTYDADNRLLKVTRVVEDEDSVTYNLSPGWNVVSFPYLPDDKDVLDVLSELSFGSDYDQISYYDQASGEWKHFVNDSEFNDFDTLTYGQGYEIFVTNQSGVSFSVEGSLDQDSYTTELKTGNNYVGTIRTTNNTVSDIMSGTSYTAVKQYNTSTEEWENLGVNDEFVLGEAYCIVMASDSSFSIEREEVEINYTYGPDGERIKKVTDNGTSVYIGTGYEKRGTTFVKSVFLGDFRIAEDRSDGSLFFLHTDHLNSTNVITDENGDDVQLYEYSPYGLTTVDDGTEEITRKFTGQEEDAESSLYYYHARYYDPELGRFIQADSVVQSPYDPQTLNRYAYCRNNPVKFVDPSGHGIIAIILGIIAIAGALAAGALYAASAIAGATGHSSTAARLKFAAKVATGIAAAATTAAFIAIVAPTIPIVSSTTTISPLLGLSVPEGMPYVAGYLVTTTTTTTYSIGATLGLAGGTALGVGLSMAAVVDANNAYNEIGVSSSSSNSLKQAQKYFYNDSTWFEKMFWKPMTERVAKYDWEVHHRVPMEDTLKLGLHKNVDIYWRNLGHYEQYGRWAWQSDTMLRKWSYRWGKKEYVGRVSFVGYSFNPYEDFPTTSPYPGEDILILDGERR
ncbi:MAG: hypothetical protein DRH04_01275 [Deltaproteobacteria bacterium]|nr:MAG: hypothetical protein DRH04_01275 [Deltaproteobacteria bacterium]